jgi:uncharacterized protein (DUF488 family)
VKTIYTMGFTSKTLQQFMEQHRAAGVREVIDIRLRSTSRMAGSSKDPDITYRLTTGFGVHGKHHLNFAPTAELLNQYHKTYDGPAYEAWFNHVTAGE